MKKNYKYMGISQAENPPINLQIYGDKPAIDTTQSTKRNKISSAEILLSS